ncbi:MAG: hypothetical protein CMP91_07995 [Gammaproteobacteria bacterium]|nr:hypothetical protein [Gammaproteobacteria bacterium]|tara:strand:- start:263489 stop:265333 length:1845 start_codon:yes stop_codon:yes gene_type:complete
MSLLMEALRKAEAAKTKQEGKDADENKLSLEPVEEAEKTPAPSPADDISDGPQPATLDELKARESDAGKQQQDPEQAEFSSEDTASPNEASEAEPPKTLFELEAQEFEEKPADDEDDGSDFGEDEFDYFVPESGSPEDNSEPEPKILDDDEIFDKINEKTGGADELYGFITDDDSFDGDSADNDAARDDSVDIAAKDNIHEPDDEHEDPEAESHEDYEALEAAAELSEYERSKTRRGQPGPDQAMLDRQTANSLFQAKKNSQNSRRQRVALLAILIALLPLGGGGFYWYYSNNVASNNLFPGVAQTTAPQGFIEDAAPPATTDNSTAPDEVLPPANEPDNATQVASEEIPSQQPEAALPEEDSADTTAPANVLADADNPPAADAPVVSAPNLLGSGNSVSTAQPSLDIQITRTTNRAEVNPDLMAAYESYQQNNLPQAQRLYTQVLNSQPNNRDALLGLAIINRQQGNIPEAQALYSRLLQLNPRDPLARAGLLQSGQAMSPARQELELRALLEDYPDVAPLAFALGNLFASQSRWNEAQNAYFDALLIASENDTNTVSPDYAFNLAVSLERLNQLELAYDYYQQAQELSIRAPAGFSTDRLNQRLAYLRGVLQ